jgi:hypothetical protein
MKLITLGPILIEEALEIALFDVEPHMPHGVESLAAFELI